MYNRQPWSGFELTSISWSCKCYTTYLDLCVCLISIVYVSLKWFACLYFIYYMTLWFSITNLLIHPTDKNYTQHNSISTPNPQSLLFCFTGGQGGSFTVLHILAPVLRPSMKHKRIPLSQNCSKWHLLVGSFSNVLILSTAICVSLCSTWSLHQQVHNNTMTTGWYLWQAVNQSIISSILPVG